MRSGVYYFTPPLNLGNEINIYFNLFVQKNPQITRFEDYN